MTMQPIRIATRKSPLAQRQAEMAEEVIQNLRPGTVCEKVLITTTGDRQQQWSLSMKGGKGLFTREIEEALLSEEADLAVHSAKDLPTDTPEQLGILGFLPREDPRDVLVLRRDVSEEAQSLTLATASPRRRAQSAPLFPDAQWTEIRGNVDTRLNKIADAVADGTFLAAAGLNRLGIATWRGVNFRPLPITSMVPAAGQGAIALQVRKKTLEWLAPACCEATRLAVQMERALLNLMEGGCQTAVGVHYAHGTLHLFREGLGYMTLDVTPDALNDPIPFLVEFLRQR